MRLIKYMIIGCLLVFFSCQKVIDLELREAEIKYVIEGIITNEPGVCKVYITLSKNFNENNQFSKVSNAVVAVSDNGVEKILSETEPGLYETSLINGTPGHVYQ